MNPVVALRPGVMVPDWTLVRSPEAERALAAVFEAFGMASKWTGISAGEDEVWRTVLTLYAHRGTAPAVDELAAAMGMPPESIREAVALLRGRDLVVSDADGAILGAYPFTDRETEHLVSFGERRVRAMCAIDALGIGAMLGEDTRIRSRCRHCDAPIEISTADAGWSLSDIAPATALVWSGVAEAHACAARSLCTVQAFFCSDEHLAAWRHDSWRGFRLSIEEALQIGAAIFAPMLRDASADMTGAGTVITRSTITCPACGHDKSETMPTDACQFFYECTGCGALLRPNKGDCCVFCSFGSVPCPPIQATRSASPGARDGCC